MVTKTDPEVEARIIELRGEGRSYDFIVEQTGLSKSTVRNVVKRAECGYVPDLSAPKIPAHTRANKKESAHVEPESPVPITSAPPSAPPSALPASDAEYVAMLTRERTAKELLTFIGLTKKSYNQSRAEREALKADKDKDRKEGQQKTWEEVQFLKLYKDGIKILVDCTGLSKEALESIPASPIDPFLEASLAKLKEDD